MIVEGRARGGNGRSTSKDQLMPAIPMLGSPRTDTSLRPAWAIVSQNKTKDFQ